MSTSGISSSLSSLSQLETLVKNDEQFLKDFQQLGTDLQSGNLSAAQQDFVTISKDAQTTAAATPSVFSNSSTEPDQSALDADFKTLRDDLKNGDLSGAQQAFTQTVNDMQSSVSSTQSSSGGSGVQGGGHHHHHAHTSSSSDSSTSSSSTSNLLEQLLQALFGSNSSTSSSSNSTSTSPAASSSSDVSSRATGCTLNVSA